MATFYNEHDNDNWKFRKLKWFLNIKQCNVYGICLKYEDSS